MVKGSSPFGFFAYELYVFFHHASKNPYILLVSWVSSCVKMKDKGKAMEKETNYRAIFSVGIVFLCSGTAIMIASGPAGIGLLGIGLVFMAVGLSHRDQWKD
jgi:hypothetical protein